MKNGLYLLIFLLLSNTAMAQTYDWPMWRCDFNRSASTPEQLADNLYLQWELEYSPRKQVWDDPLNQNLMQYDRIFEPVVAGNKLFIGFNDQDKVVALDLNSGLELWHFYTDGPVRLPLAIHKGKVCFTSDDGCCYCLNTSDGSVVWKRLLAPAGNKLLGNKRLISMWPARGGIVLKDGIIYTAASIFPLMGTFIYALDANSGDIIWKNESTGSNYILQPHRSPAFADVAPQGAFTISGDKLLVAGGRSVPAAFDLKTGRKLYYHLAATGKTGGAFTCASDKVFFNHHRERNTTLYDAETGIKLLPGAGEYPVIAGDTFYFSGKNILAARLDTAKILDTIWHSTLSATNDLILAGDCLYAADSAGIKAIRIRGKKQEVIWSYNTQKNIERLLAANGKLIAVSLDGTLMIFGDRPLTKVAGNSKTMKPENAKPDKVKSGSVISLVRNTGITEGYCLVMGSENTRFLKNLVQQTDLNIIVYERDSHKIQGFREYFDKAGVSAERLSFLQLPNNFPLLPKYFSSLSIINDPACLTDDKESIEKLYESTRPYGGKILIKTKGKNQAYFKQTLDELNLPGAVLTEKEAYSVISREGSLEGASSWTHNYGDIANTVKSDDKLVKAPLGILWFGGNSNMDVLPRHGHGPGEQVIDGRLIIQGINSISARDVYTGRVLWKRESETLLDDNWLVFYNETYDEENPLDPKYNQVHLPGSNSRGTNYIATSEYVYLIEGNKCQLLDIQTGEPVKVFDTGLDDTRKIGYIGVYDTLLILGNNYAEFPDIGKDTLEPRELLFMDYDRSASSELIVLNRFTGEKLWNIEANHGFIHNSVIAGDGMVFCLDKLPQFIETKMKRRGETLPEGSRLLYLDAGSGEVIHELTKDVFGTWLGYSDQFKLLLQATRPSRDMLNGEEGNRMITYNVKTKEKIWDKAVVYTNPPIIHNDKIYTEEEGFFLLTGEPINRTDPITGEDIKWSYKREYGCGIVAASEYLLTFRSASAGFINLETSEGTGSLGGWKASCSTNLIAADGVLNSPDYTRTCQCPYQNQTSLALVYMPWMAYWTNSNYSWSGKQIKQLGLNFNAPGDRSTENMLLWLEYPSVAGIPSGIPVKTDSTGITKIRKEPYIIASEKTPWVSSSALAGLKNIEITLSKEELIQESYYTVRLYFAELENRKSGERIFDITIQDKKVVDGFDIISEAGKADTEIVKSFQGIKAGKTLKVELAPVSGNTLISGIEIVREDTENESGMISKSVL